MDERPDEPTYAPHAYLLTEPMIPPITRRSDDNERCYCRCSHHDTDDSRYFETVAEFDRHRSFAILADDEPN